MKDIKSKEELLTGLPFEVESIHVWECNGCSTRFESEDGMTEAEFAEMLYDEHGVRKVETDFIVGTFCDECINEVDFEEWC